MASSNITLSAGVRSNLLSLQSTADLMGRTQNRLATGKKVNTALDNPTNFFTSASLQSRAGEMSALLDNMSSGIKTLEAADNGITAINKTIESMQSTLRQARQDKSYKTGAFTFAADFDTTAVETMSFSGGLVGTTPVSINLNTIDSTATATTLAGTGANFGTNFTGGNVNINGTNVAIRGDVAAVASSVTGAGGSDLTADPDLSALDGESITLTATNGDTSTYSFDNTASGQAADLETALEQDGFTVARTANGLNISRADGVEFTVATSDAAVDAVVGLTGGTTTANGTEAFDATATTVEADLDASGITGLTASVSGGQVSLSLASGADITITGSTLATAIGFGSGNLTSTNGTEAVVGALKTVDTLVSEINSHATLGGKVRASNDSGKLRIENLSTQELTVTSTSADVTDDLGASNQIGGNTVRANLIDQFNALRDQLNKLADDASFNGVNLLRGDKLKLTFNETGTSTMEIQAKNESGAERPINAATLEIDFALDGDFDVDADIDSRLDTLQTALGTLRSQASAFGSNLSIVQNRTEFTKNMVNTLQTGADSLVLADTNEEAANMLALQTRQQLSSTALSLASQADQAVLRLF